MAYDFRSLIAPNHIRTHCLNFSLRNVLGDKVEQRGSEVDANKLRFDFTHQVFVPSKELKVIETQVKQFINENKKVGCEVTSLEGAKKIYRLRAVFGETYSDFFACRFHWYAS